MKTQTTYQADAAQWSRELELHRDYLLKIAGALAKDAVAAEDIVQETILAALHSRVQFERRASVRTWLTAILKRKVLDHLRSMRRAPTPMSALQQSSREMPPPKLFDAEGTWLNTPRFWDHPEHALTQRDFMKVFESCLDRLPDAAAHAFVLRAVLDVETDEVASAIGLSPNHLGVTLYRARLALRECLSAHWFTGEVAS